jgi:5-methyltetrahydrofolate--homocysteine methyltransferase
MPQQKYTNRRYLDALKNRVLVFDGAMGTNLQRQNLTAEHFGGEKYAGCNDYLVITYPQAVESVHRSFLEVGVDVIETCTFRSNRITMKEYGLEGRIIEINQAAGRLARRLADEYSTVDHPRFVAGSMGPSGKLPSMDDPQLSDVDYDDLSEVFKEQAIGLIQGGVDLLLVETSQDILEVKAVIDGIQKAFHETGEFLPIQAQVTLDTTGRMLLGTDISAVQTILDGLPIDVIGLNCSTGPEHMREPIKILGETSTLPVSCIPNAGLPLNVDGQAVYPLQPEPFADMLFEFIEKYHIQVVGGCCGTTPDHLQKLVEKVGQRVSDPPQSTYPPTLASSVLAVSMQQDPSPFFIGERLNTQGSAKFKKVLMSEDFDGVVDIARQQVDGGAHGLDICTALTERPDEKDLMKRVVKKLSTAVKAPFIIDTTEPDVMEAALKIAPGRCLINYTNLESGRAKADRVFGLAKRYNAAVLALTIDETGMAKTADRKLEIARRLYDMAVNEYKLRPGDLVIDALTFTLATGEEEYQNSAVETFEGIRRIKTELPGVLTSLGVSNSSFGLTPNTRQVLNSVMLYHAVCAGLDMAIVNPAQLIPYADLPQEEIDLCEDLIFNRRPDALQRLTDHFSVNASAAVKEQKKDPMEGMNAAERLHWKILHRHKDGVEVDVDSLVLEADPSNRNAKAVTVLNQVLLPAMKEVGDKFGAGELILPFVLQSAEVMKKTVTHLETYLEKKEGSNKGKIILATVYGDVHDIGKNLVKTILSNNGYEVVDLGKQVPADTIIQAAIDQKADAIGLSALLVSTSKQMPLIVN